MAVNNILGNGQPQAVASHFPGASLVHPIEPLKNFTAILRAKANARILDGEYRLAAVACLGSYSDRAIFWGVLNGIIH